jgi:hypothetical protein
MLHQLPYYFSKEHQRELKKEKVLDRAWRYYEELPSVKWRFKNTPQVR